MLCAVAGGALSSPGKRDELATGFQNPPDSAKPHTWWHWMNGNVTKEGITADLEAMKRVGVGGAQIFNVDCGIPPGPVKFMSEQWLTMIKHAAKEADRLGVELCIHNCAGWSSSGGPWNTPKHAMQVVVTSERQVKGLVHFSEALAQPTTRLGFYRDIAVLAFPTPASEKMHIADFAPRVTSSAATFDGAKLIDGNRSTFAFLPVPEGGKSQYVQVEFAQPFPARSLALVPGPGVNECSGEFQVSGDGQSFRAVHRFTITRESARQTVRFSTAEAIPARAYRVLFTWASSRLRRINVAEVELSPGLRIEGLEGKAGYDRVDGLRSGGSMTAAPEAVVRRDRVVDLTSRLDAEGRLTWDTPEGDWTILRLGYTPNGRNNHPAPAEGTGLECDKLSREAAEAHWAGMMQTVLNAIGPLAGKSLNNVLIDSYEVGSQNWTPLFRDEFKRRRGYDPLLYLPAFTGRVVESPGVTERFLWDLRRTIADLFADNYFGHFATMAHQRGMKLSVEPYGNGLFQDLACGGKADIPMGEFWVGGGAGGSTKLAASVAHAYGRKVVGAESFTASPEVGRWQNDPYSMKALGDAVYCMGVNRYIFHRYAQQPWLDRFPGMTMGPWGFHFDRTSTWWEQGAAWLRYVARCEFLLQQGLFVADGCYFCGEDAPNSLWAGEPALPKGYDYDGCDAEVILTRMSVREGRLVLPDGMSYRVMILPPSDTMTPGLLRKVRELVREGATIVGPKPARSPSLQDYPTCDQEVKSLADEVWGNCDGKTVTDHAFGKGRVFWGQPMNKVLASLKLLPDFEFTSNDKAARLVYIHRKAGDAEVYFVSNQLPRPTAVECSFRVTGKAPELWRPDTGQIEKAPVYAEREGRTRVSLLLGPAGSVFVVFRRPADADSVASVRRDGESVFRVRPGRVPKLEIVKAVYGVLTEEQPGMVDVTAQLKRMVRNGTLTVVASNAIAGDPAQDIVKQLRVEYTLNGKALSKTVDEGQTLKLPDEGAGGELEIRKALYGVLPTEPVEPVQKKTVDVTAQLRRRVRNGVLSVVADNSLAGDPALMIVKQMRVDYIEDGVSKVRTIGENQLLEIPEVPVNASVSAELAITNNNRVELRAWEAGNYELTTASGKAVMCKVASVPPPVEIAGPWELRFPPHWGAPAKVTFPKLMSWTEHGDPGVKYFSGAATYVKEVDVPATLIGKDKALYLDLGQVKVNGKDFGVLWKPPFRVEVTNVARVGRNRLEVQVTNLWPNRLIGDDQLPEDCEWNGVQLRGWPRWLLEGKPSPTGRLTFTTWKHWTKDSPLLESGLLGPVTLRVAKKVAVQVR